MQKQCCKFLLGIFYTLRNDIIFYLYSYLLFNFMAVFFYLCLNNRKMRDKIIPVVRGFPNKKIYKLRSLQIKE